MQSTFCSTPSCPAEAKVRGMCLKHYGAWYRSTPRSRQLIDMSPTARFERKFVRGAPSDCWEWQGARKSSGHGNFALTQNSFVVASNHSLALFTGGRPDGAFALHHCDNPPCVNPQHLYWGTYQDNANDRVSRNRQPRGSMHARSQLTESQVLHIRERYAAGESVRSIADSLGQSRSAVTNSATHMTWKHVGGPSRPSRKKINIQKKES